MKVLFLLIFIFTLLFSDYSPPWLINVESTYSDVATQKTYKVKGYGVIFSIVLPDGKNEYYVLANSHVASQQGLKLGSEAKEISLDKTRLSLGNSNTDLMLIAINDPHIPYIQIPYYDFEIGRIVVPDISSDPELKLEKTIEDLPSFLNYSYHPTICDENSARIGVKPGMSGAPLLRHNDKYDESYIVGITKRAERFSKLSYFTTAEQIRELIGKLLVLKGELPISNNIELSDSRWISKNGMLFRIWNNGSEVVFKSNVIKDGVFLSGSYSQYTGGGESVDTGGGESVDTGNPNKISNSFEEIQNRILPGIIDEGKHIIAYRISTQLKPLKEAYVFATPLAREFKKSNDRIFDYTLIPFDTNYSDMFKSKVQVDKGTWEEKSSDGTKTIELTKAGHVKVSIEMKNKKSNVNFELDEKGALVGAKEDYFKPIIEVKDENNKSYWIDIRGIYFSNLDQIKDVPGRNNEEFIRNMSYLQTMSMPSQLKVGSSMLNPEFFKNYNKLKLLRAKEAFKSFQNISILVSDEKETQVISFK